ncbi:MAG: TolC family protein [Fibrella sp.]|nr:TolC family protein [Armatimonadota bacterium]
MRYSGLPFYGIAALLVAFLSGVRSQAQDATPMPSVAPERLSVSEAVTRAKKYNPLPSSAQARLRGAAALASGAARQPNPNLALARPFGSSNTGGFGEDVIASQTLEPPDKIRYRTQAARATRDAATADRLGADVDIILSTKAAYFEALRADAEVEQASNLLAATRRFADAAQIQFDAGDAPRSNVVRSQIELSRAEQTLLAAQTDRDNRYATLRSLIGLTEAMPLLLTDALVYEPKTYDLSALLPLATQTRPDVLSARRLLAARGADVRGAKAQRQPDLVVEGRHATLFGNSGDQNTTLQGDSVRVGVVFPIFDYGRIRADVGNSQALRDEQEANLREAERVARLDVETVFRERRQAVLLVESFQNGRLTRSKEILEMVNTGYANGANSYLEVIDAQRVYQLEQVEYARALAAVNTATARLERAVGGKLP